jgi:hypothetical protein
MNLIINQREIDEVKSPYVPEMVVQTTLDKMDEAINSNGHVIFEDVDGNITLILNTLEELIRWKEQNAIWLPQANIEGGEE